MIASQRNRYRFARPSPESNVNQRLLLIGPLILGLAVILALRLTGLWFPGLGIIGAACALIISMVIARIARRRAGRQP